MIGLHFRLQRALRIDDAGDELYGEGAFGEIVDGPAARPAGSASGIVACRGYLISNK